jgi:hypothetical protein
MGVLSIVEGPTHQILTRDGDRVTQDEDRDENLEAATRAWLCTRWPQLRAEAERQGWVARLDQAQAALRGGTAPSRVGRRLGLTIDESQLTPFRGDADYVTLADFGLDPVATTGDYGCPYHRCPQRRAPRPDGGPPSCVDGAPMQRLV